MPVPAHRLTAQEARRIAVRAQLLDDDRPVDLVDTVRHLVLVQADQTRAVAPSAQLVAWARLGFGFAPHHLADALAERRLVEFRGFLRPAGDIALLRAEMAAWHAVDTAPAWGRTRVEWVEANAGFRADVLARIAADGPLTARDLPDTCEVPWRSSGWNAGRNAVMMVDSLELRGEVAATGELRGRDRLWDLASRVWPDGEVVPLVEAREQRHRRTLAALGVARARGPASEGGNSDVGEAGETAEIDGVKGRWRVDPAQLDRPFEGRVALLSPLDRLVFDRARTAELFDFDYQLEMYKPAAKRRFGYWALPVLAGDALVGKVDATADRTAGVLRVDAVHRDRLPGGREWDDELADEVDVELDALAEWLGLRLRRADRGE